MNINTIASDLFDKIRGRFPSVTIGDENGKITNIPEESRFYDFGYTAGGVELGKVSVSLDQDKGLSVVVGRDFVNNEAEEVQDNWYNFLRELRQFAKKRMMSFDVRDINKTNLSKKDYEYMAQNRGETTMAESKLYGTNKTSYQKIGNARVAIRHTAPIGEGESRLKNIGSIFIETPEGEKFKYPVKHLQGARALAVHISEGGHAYDDFGKYITSLSEELASLGKFKTYMNRKNVMAEALSEYMDVVQSRVKDVKREISNLQKPAYYAEAFANFVAPVMENVPSDIEEAWIDQLTVKQFKEDIKDVFPYIYNLIGENMKAAEIGYEDLIGESGLQYYTGVKKHGKEYMKKAAEAGRKGASQEELGRLKDKYSKAEKKTKEELELESAFESMMGQFADESYSPGDENEEGMVSNCCSAPIMDVVDGFGRCSDCKEMAEAVPETDEGNAYAHAVRKAKMNGKKKGDKIPHPDGSGDDITLEKQKTPIGEFILSYFDRETGKFPKGETAVLTMVEKQYGDQYVKPAAQFMQKVESTIAQRKAEEMQQSRYPETEIIKQLAGV